MSLFGATSDEGKTADPKAAHVPVPTPRFRIGGGGYYGSRSLTFQAENQTGPLAYAGVPSKGLEVNAAVYPFPTQKVDGALSGVGFSFGLSHSAGSLVTFDDGATVSEYTISQSAFKAGVHYRHQLASLVAIDGEVNYGRASYLIADAPVEFEVPDVQYTYLGAGAHLDLAITSRATVGFGARYMYLLDVGDISSVDWYGPGRASGFGLDGNFVIPLPSNLYVRGALSYERYKIDLRRGRADHRGRGRVGVERLDRQRLAEPRDRVLGARVSFATRRSATCRPSAFSAGARRSPRSSTGGCDRGGVTRRERRRSRAGARDHVGGAVARVVLLIGSTTPTTKDPAPCRTPRIDHDPFMSIDAAELAQVAGGAARVTARASGASDQLMTMMTQIGDSIKALASSNQNSGSDPMQMMMMMMMMGGMGGGGGSAAPAAAPAPTPQVSISTCVKRGC